MGVGAGVFWAVAFGTGTFGGPISPVYTVPSSPGSNVSVEQNPSDDEINNVKPSLDLNKGIASALRV